MLRIKLTWIVPKRGVDLMNIYKVTSCCTKKLPQFFGPPGMFSVRV